MKNKTLMLAVLLAVATLLSGCMGKFLLTTKVYKWNKTVSHERWVNEGVFVALLVVPVYNLTLLADGIIFNSVEWWTGRNPVARAGDTRRVEGVDGSVALMTLRADGDIDLDFTPAAGAAARYTLRREDGRVALYGVDGLPVDTLSAL